MFLNTTCQKETAEIYDFGCLFFFGGGDELFGFDGYALRLDFF